MYTVYTVYTVYSIQCIVNIKYINIKNKNLYLYYFLES